MKYKIGDKIKIRTDLKGSRFYTTEKNLDLFCAHEMEEFRGQICTIEKIGKNKDIYILDSSGKWVWCAEMFEPYREENEL